MDRHRENVWLRHQQARWLRPDAYRWIRPDAARFVAPGSTVADAFPALSRKYNPNQPRVPAGNPDGGQWTDGGSGSAAPMGDIGFGNLSELADFPDLFQITPSETDLDGVQLAQHDLQSGSRIDLDEEEQRGGHAISEHVGRSETYLKSRVRDEAAKILDRGDEFGGLGIGSFTSLQSANRLVNSTIAQNRDRVDAVAQGMRSSAFVKSRFSSPTGYEAYLPRAHAEPYMRDTFGVGVVVLRDARSARGWRIQSAFPER